MQKFGFKILTKYKKIKARVGEIYTPHGVIKTPAFVPVGTQGSVKSLTPDELKSLDVQLFIVNTYHMYLRPGIEVVRKSGGLHKFIGWDKPLITDSGGFQVFSLGREKNRSRESFFGDARRPQSDTSSRIPFSLNEDSLPISINESDEINRRVFSAPQNVHSRASLVKVNEDGVEFQSHWDGSKHFFTPESSMQHQWDLGSDIHIAFDDCTPYPATHEQAKKSMERTHRWAVRSLGEHNRLRHSERSEESLSWSEKNSRIREGSFAPLGMTVTRTYQALYGVIQGSTFEDLRKESAKFITSMDFDGIAIGGVSVGESKKEMVKVLTWVTPLLPSDKPRHLLGVGEIDDIFALVEHGMDIFDCVQSTRLARTGHIYNAKCQMTNAKWAMDLTKKIYAEDEKPLEEGCKCYTCAHFTRAYLHHLFAVRELLAYRLATIHNIYFINTLMSDIRKSIVNNTFLDLKEKWLYNNR